MSTHTYTRKNVASGYANPGMGDPDLPTRIKDSLPGKDFVIRANGASLQVIFTDTLTAGETTTLDTEYTNWAPVDPAPTPPVAPQPNFEATVAPTATDDEDLEYSTGSCWVDTTTNKAYICLDATAGAAVWKETTTVAGLLANWQGAWATSTAYSVNDGVENNGSSYICIVAHTSAAADEPGVGGSWQANWDLVVSKGDLPYSDEVFATDLITTTSSSHVLATSMTITPPAGTYMVFWAASVHNTGNNDQVWIQIYAGGSAAGVEMHYQRGGAQADIYSGLTCVERVTVNGSEAIEGRWRQSGGTGEMQGRTLAIVEVAP